MGDSKARGSLGVPSIRALITILESIPGASVYGHSYIIFITGPIFTSPLPRKSGIVAFCDCRMQDSIQSFGS